MMKATYSVFAPASVGFLVQPMTLAGILQDPTVRPFTVFVETGPDFRDRAKRVGWLHARLTEAMR